MEQAFAKLTVFFESPFWVGVLERSDRTGYAACKIVFVAEPKDGEIYNFLLKNYHKLRLSPALAGIPAEEKRTSPKRMQREIRRVVQSSTGMGTKAQQALKLQQQQGKLERKSHTREQREAEQERQYAIHRQKRKEKHRGH